MMSSSDQESATPTPVQDPSVTLHALARAILAHYHPHLPQTPEHVHLAETSSIALLEPFCLLHGLAPSNATPHPEQTNADEYGVSLVVLLAAQAACAALSTMEGYCGADINARSSITFHAIIEANGGRTWDQVLDRRQHHEAKINEYAHGLAADDPAAERAQDATTPMSALLSDAAERLAHLPRSDMKVVADLLERAIAMTGSATVVPLAGYLCHAIDDWFNAKIGSAEESDAIDAIDKHRKALALELTKVIDKDSVIPHRSLSVLAHGLQERSHAWWQLRKDWSHDERTEKLARQMSDEIREATAKIERLIEKERKLMDTFGGTTLSKHGLREETKG